MAIDRRKLLKICRELGCTERSGKGSHVVLYRDGHHYAVPDRKVLADSFVKRLCRQLGLPEQAFHPEKAKQAAKGAPPPPAPAPPAAPKK